MNDTIPAQTHGVLIQVTPELLADILGVKGSTFKTKLKTIVLMYIGRAKIMEQQLQVFNNLEFTEIRWVKLDGADYAVANDIAKALGYSDCQK